MISQCMVFSGRTVVKMMVKVIAKNRKSADQAAPVMKQHSHRSQHSRASGTLPSFPRLSA